MLNRIEATNRRGNVLTFYMEENDDPFQIVDVDGLDPVDASLVSTSYATLDGEQFQSAKRGPRDIKIKLEMDPDFVNYTYTSLRRKLYSHFMPKSQISLRFYLTSGLYLDIVGIVEELSAPLFDEDPVVDISVRCFQPDFVDPRIVTIEGMTVASSVDTAINYPGTVETGVVLTLNVNRVLSAFSIYSMDEAETLYQTDFEGSLQAGDILVVSSLKGAKGITLTRAGISSSYLYGRSAQSSWIEFSEGVNNFRVYAVGDPIPYELEYVVRYGGL